MIKVTLNTNTLTQASPFKYGATMILFNAISIGGYYYSSTYLLSFRNFTGSTVISTQLLDNNLPVTFVIEYPYLRYTFDTNPYGINISILILISN